MDDLEKSYYKLSFILLSGIGLWPGKSTILRRIQKVGWSCIVLSLVILPLLPFMTMQYVANLVLSNGPMILAGTGCLLKYFTFILQNNDVKEITEFVKYDWSTTKDDEETKIFMDHADVGRSMATAFAKLFYVALVIFLLIQYTPWFVNLVVPVNETRGLQLFVTIEIFVDHERGFYIVALVFNVLLVAMITVYVATETVNMMWLEHHASLLEIYAFNAQMNKFLWSYFILIGVGVASVSVTLYRLSVALETLDNLEELVMCVILIIPVFSYMFYANYMQQQVLDSYNNVYTHTYDSNWYRAPLHAQKMLLYVMLRNSQPLNGKWYGMYHPSMEGFTIMVKMTFSYYMMIHSMR